MYYIRCLKLFSLHQNGYLTDYNNMMSRFYHTTTTEFSFYNNNNCESFKLRVM